MVVGAKKRLLRVLVVGVFVLLLGLAAASNYFYNVGVARTDKDFMADNPDLPVAEMKEFREEEKAWFDKQTVETLYLPSYDGLQLNAYYLQALEPTRKTAILVHGYSGNGRGMAGYARFYRDELGYNVLMPDNRGHGESEGSYIGFGWHDRLDLLQWVHKIISRDGDKAEIILHGVSMGGATVLMASGEELPGNVKCVVSDCAYTSAKDVLSFQMKQLYGLPAFPLIQTTSLVCQLRAGYTFSEASAVEQVKKATVPILFIHGEADAFVPTEMVYPLYDNCRTPKELLLVPNAAHGFSFYQDRQVYQQTVEEFLDQFI